MSGGKLKTKSGAKKRFRANAAGLLKAGRAGKRHNMLKRSNRQLRRLKRAAPLASVDQANARRFLPYGAR